MAAGIADRILPSRRTALTFGAIHRDVDRAKRPQWLTRNVLKVFGFQVSVRVETTCFRGTFREFPVARHGETPLPPATSSLRSIHRDPRVQELQSPADGA